MKKMMLIFPHPDDESFTSGGVAAKYAQNGWQVDLVCATRGEAGSRGSFEDSPLSTGDLRQKELELAAKILGIKQVIFLGYKDGLLPSLASGELEEKVYKILVDKNPHVIITHEPDGISNHPDHKRLTIATTYAFQKYTRGLLLPQSFRRKVYGRSSIPKELSESVKDSDKPKLYYGCIPQSVVSYLQTQKVLPKTSFGGPMIGVEDSKVTTIIDISRYANKKVQAIRAHQTQKNDVDRYLLIENTPLLRQEYYMLRMIGIHEYFMGKKDRVSDRL